MPLKRITEPRLVMWDMDYIYKHQELLYPSVQSLPQQDNLVSTIESLLTIDKDPEEQETLLPLVNEDSSESEVRRYIDQLKREGYEPTSHTIEDHGTGLILQFQYFYFSYIFLIFSRAKADSLPSFEEFHLLLNKLHKRRPSSSISQIQHKKSHISKKRQTPSPSIHIKSLSVRDSIEEYMKLRGKGRNNTGGKNFDWDTSKLSFPSNRVLYEYYVRGLFFSQSENIFFRLI